MKNRLEKIYSEHHRPEYLKMDPLGCVHAFSNEHDLEIAGLLAASLAYGRVEIIIRNVQDAFCRMGPDLRDFVVSTSFARKHRLLDGFRHRFNDARDIALLLESIKRVYDEHGSLHALFALELDETAACTRMALDNFTGRLKSHACAIAGTRRASFEYLLPSPGSGSACKRMNMYLRWMVRRNDGVDLGVWHDVPSSKLIMPIDTHIARIGRVLNFSQRKTADWKMAEEITASLRRIDPADPVRFDFSLCHAGMLDFRKGT